MCFSADVSLTTFLIGFTASIILYFKVKSIDIKITALFLAYVSSMQLIEFLLWKNQECNEINKTLSYIGMWLNHLQPIVFAILVLVISKTPNILGIILISIAYLAVFIPYSLQYKNTEDLRCSTRHAGNPHIIWNWNRLQNFGIVYLVFLFTVCTIPFLGFSSKTNAYIFAVYCIITYVASVFLYREKDVIGSMWCLFTAVVPPVFLLSTYTPG